MLEVEVKAQVQNRAALEKRLAAEGIVLGDLQIQTDRVFVKNMESIEAFYKNAIFVRIREQAGKQPVLTLKKKRQELASLEYETEVVSTEVMSQILEELGLTHALTIQKTRSKAKYGEYTLCVDEVVDLGVFIEVEKLVEEGDASVIQAELFDFLQSFGINEDERVFDAYDTLLLKKKFNNTAL